MSLEVNFIQTQYVFPQMRHTFIFSKQILGKEREKKRGMGGN